jgi:hypothetical protein
MKGIGEKKTGKKERARHEGYLQRLLVTEKRNKEKKKQDMMGEIVTTQEKTLVTSVLSF